MPGPTFLRSLIPRLAREYTDPAAALAALQKAAPQFPLSELQTLWGEYTAQQALAPVEPGQDLRFRPNEAELLEQTVLKGRPFMHEVLVMGRTRSGHLISKRLEIPVDRLTARWRAIRRAEELASGMVSTEGPKDTDLVTVYAGLHIGAYRRRYA